VRVDPASLDVEIVGNGLGVDEAVGGHRLPPSACVRIVSDGLASKRLETAGDLVT
jgi:hypothetical protein